MDSLLHKINTEVYQKNLLQISDFVYEKESKEYDACRFKLNSASIIYRKAKITPSKLGQFVTCWKRNTQGTIEPFSDSDAFDFLILTVNRDAQLGQFVFPKSILIQKGILSTALKEGKRAFRLYPSWDVVTNKQAKESQKWQNQFFYVIDSELDLNQFSPLFEKEILE